jgi:hypothetical protein
MATCCSRYLFCHSQHYAYLFLKLELDKVPFMGGQIVTIGTGILESLWSGFPDSVGRNGFRRLVHGGFWYELYEAHTTY